MKSLGCVSTTTSSFAFRRTKRPYSASTFLPDVTGTVCLHFRIVTQEHWLFNEDYSNAPEIPMKKIRSARFARHAQLTQRGIVFISSDGVSRLGFCLETRFSKSQSRRSQVSSRSRRISVSVSSSSSRDFAWVIFSWSFAKRSSL